MHCVSLKLVGERCLMNEIDGKECVAVLSIIYN